LGANGRGDRGPRHLRGGRALGGKNPRGIPLFVVTHRPAGQPPGGGFVIAASLAGAIDRARAAAGGKLVHLMGGADLIRQALAAGRAGELTIIIAPVTLGVGKLLSGGFGESPGLKHHGVRQSPFATFIDYRVKKVKAGS
jgi:dihydrofolate reductase